MVIYRLLLWLMLGFISILLDEKNIHLDLLTFSVRLLYCAEYFYSILGLIEKVLPGAMPPPPPPDRYVATGPWHMPTMT